MNHFTLTATALRRRKARTVFTGLSVLVVFILFGLAMALRHGFIVGPTMAGNDMIIVSRKGHGELPIGIVQQLAAINGVKSVAPFAFAPLEYQGPKNQIGASGVDPQAFLANYRKTYGAMDAAVAQRWLADRTGAVVMEKYLTDHNLHWQVGQTIVLTPPKGMPLQPLTVHIDGILSPQKNTGISIGGPLTAHLKYLNAWRGQDTIQAAFVTAADAAQSDTVADAITRAFASSPTPLEAQDFHSLLLSILQRFGDIGAMTIALIAAALLSLLFVTANAMAQSVAERRAEFALLKTLGFNRVRVGFLVFGETILLTAPPALIGLGLTGWLVATLANHNNVVPLPGFALDGGSYLVGIGAIAGLIVISSLAPLWLTLRAAGAQTLRAA